MTDTFTIRAKCDAGHEKLIVARGMYREAADLFASVLDGSINPAGMTRLREINDPALRVGRCNLVHGGTLCDAWLTCSVEEGDTSNGSGASIEVDGSGTAFIRDVIPRDTEGKT